MTATSPDLVAVPASPGKRVAALLIDIVGAALFGAVASALSHGNVAIIVTTIVEYVALQAILIALHGRSVGAFLARCALVRAGSSQLSPSLMVSAGYVLLTALSSLIPPLPVIFVLLGGQRGSWMAKLFSLQCVTFVPEDTIDEAVASSSPYGKAGAGIAEGHTSFSSVTDIPSAPISHSSESPASAQPSVELPKPSVELPKPSAPASSRAWPAPAPASSVPYVPGPQIPAPVQEVPAAAPVQEKAMPEAPATAPAPTPAWAREAHTPKAPIGAPIPTPRPVQEMQAPKAPVASPAPTACFSAPSPQPPAREASAEAPPAKVEAPRPPEPAVPTTAPAVPTTALPAPALPAPALPTTAPKPAATATNSTTASAPASASYAALLLDTGQSIPVNRTIVLGRAPSPQRATDSPIPVEDQTRSLSRTHVRIAPSEGGITIEDLNSANGTRARSPNGQTHTLVPGQPIELPMNSQLLLGERLISVVDLRQRR